MELARRAGAEILVVDSMTVYRGMEVGTAKPALERREGIPHHLLDLADPADPFSVARFKAAAREVLRDLRRKGTPALLVGGSGLYYRAVVDDLRFPGTDPSVRRALEAEASAGETRLHARLRTFDPQAAAKIDPSNTRRTVRALEVAAITGRRFSSFARAWKRYPSGGVRAAGVMLSPEVLRLRIEARARRMLDGSLIDEVRRLRDRGFGRFLTSSQAIGYLEVSLHLQGRLSSEEVLEAIVRRTRNLARRQMAWFRRDPRVRWFPVGPGGAMEAVEEIEGYLWG
jgi:tRNA dimethylallyltransferase